MDKYTIIVEKDEDGVLIGSAVELPGCHTQAKTYDELCSRMKEAIELYLEVEKDRVPEKTGTDKTFASPCEALFFAKILR